MPQQYPTFIDNALWFIENPVRRFVVSARKRTTKSPTSVHEFDFWSTFWTHSIVSLIIFGVVCSMMLIAPNSIPFGLFEFWRFDTFDSQVLIDTWPLFAWGIGMTALHSIRTRNKPEENLRAERYLTGGLGISICAGFFEEVVFRWLVFYWAIPVVTALDAITGGLWQWFYVEAMAPTADFFTFGKLHHLLFNGLGWAVGSAIIFSNSRFRDGHSYQGWFGLINSWYIGMFLFLVMFEHGLPMAIAIHFLYDLFVFLVRYVDAAIERKLRWI